VVEIKTPQVICRLEVTEPGTGVSLEERRVSAK
jgi:hypothetical protein